MTDCGLTEMVKTSKTKFELWFRKQTASFTYVLEVNSYLLTFFFIRQLFTFFPLSARVFALKNLFSFAVLFFF